jgi:hypothetical protein
MSLWSVLELFQFGPIASKATSAAKDEYQGMGLRDRVTLATDRALRVDEQIVNQKYTAAWIAFWVSAVACLGSTTAVLRRF